MCRSDLDESLVYEFLPRLGGPDAERALRCRRCRGERVRARSVSRVVFAWREGQTPSAIIFFNRSARPPAWATQEDVRHRFPVTMLTNPAVGRTIAIQVEDDARGRRRFSIFEAKIADVNGQVVTQLFYRDQFREQFGGAFGFTVNLPWVRRYYFQELAGQVARIGSTREGLTLAIVDDRGDRVAMTDAQAQSAPVSQRTFQMMFFDPLVVALDPTNTISRRPWTVRVGLLRYLVERQERVVYRDQLLREIWGYPDTPNTRSVDHAIARLRKKIEDNAHNPRFIHTVHGDGYWLTPAGRSGVQPADPRPL
jgi:hypothetical protein